jgi:hypothetical protein
MSGEPLVIAVASGVFVLIYSIFQSLFNKVKESTSKSKHIEVPETFKEQLHVKDKVGLIRRIDYWIDNNNYKEALNICNIYTEYNGTDEVINKRIKFINKNI